MDLKNPSCDTTRAPVNGQRAAFHPMLRHPKSPSTSMVSMWKWPPAPLSWRPPTRSA